MHLLHWRSYTAGHILLMKTELLVAFINSTWIIVVNLAKK